MKIPPAPVIFVLIFLWHGSGAFKCMNTELQRLTVQSSGDDEGAISVSLNYTYSSPSHYDFDFDVVLQNDLSRHAKFKIELQQDFVPSYVAAVSLQALFARKNIKDQLDQCSNIKKLPLRKNVEYKGRKCNFNLADESFILADFAMQFSPMSGKWSFINEDDIDVVQGRYLVNITRCNEKEQATP